MCYFWFIEGLLKVAFTKFTTKGRRDIKLTELLLLDTNTFDRRHCLARATPRGNRHLCWEALTTALTHQQEHIATLWWMNSTHHVGIVLDLELGMAAPASTRWVFGLPMDGSGKTGFVWKLDQEFGLIVLLWFWREKLEFTVACARRYTTMSIELFRLFHNKPKNRSIVPVIYAFLNNALDPMAHEWSRLKSKTNSRRI